MREQKKGRRLGWMKWQPSFSVSIKPFMILLVMIGSPVLLYSGFAIARKLHTLPATPTVSKTVATNGATVWHISVELPGGKRFPAF